MRSLAADLWIADGAEIDVAGLKFPTRMTVVRLADGGLWVHSPVQWCAELDARLSALGPICALVAPNHFHLLYIAQWAERHPEARVFMPSGFERKRPDLAPHDRLSEQPDPLWAQAIEQCVFRGNRLMEEWVFFHRASRTLVLTDLWLELRTEEFGAFGRWFARFDQVASPRGGTPRLFRWTMRSRDDARRAVDTMMGWQPERIVISHGEVIAEQAVERLAATFAWVYA